MVLLKFVKDNLLKIYKVVYITLLIKSKLKEYSSFFLNTLALSSEYLSTVLENELASSFSHDVLNVFVDILYDFRLLGSYLSNVDIGLLVETINFSLYGCLFSLLMSWLPCLATDLDLTLCHYMPLEMINFIIYP